MCLQKGDHIPQLIQAQGLHVVSAAALEFVLQGLAGVAPKPSFAAAKRDLDFGTENDAGDQRPHINVCSTLDIPS